MIRQRPERGSKAAPARRGCVATRARDDRERITMFASVAKILSLGPEEVEAVEARLAEPPGLVSRLFDADLPFFSR